MQTYAIIFGIAALAFLLAGVVFKIMLSKIQNLTRDKMALEASNAALKVELGQALSRLEINQHVQQMSPDELQQKVSGGDSPATGGGLIGELRKPAAPAGQPVQRRPEDPAV